MRYFSDEKGHLFVSRGEWGSEIITPDKWEFTPNVPGLTSYTVLYEDAADENAAFQAVYKSMSLEAERKKKSICEEYLKGLASYLDMVLDAELFEKNREVYRAHLNAVDVTIIALSRYNPGK